MKLSQLIRHTDLLSGVGLPEDSEPVRAVTSDSRQAGPGAVFVAIKGHAADGHDYMAQAIENGAMAVVAQENPLNLDRVLLVKDTRKTLADLAARFYGHPSRDMTLVGVTGTNGKTTVTWLLESIFTRAGFNCGVIGTVNIRYNGQVTDNPITTPDALVIQKTLSEMKAAGVTHVVTEVSSHGLTQFRVNECEFNAGIFTNLTQDHLDYHPDMEAYFLCKQSFFTDFIAVGPKTPSAVINVDHAYGIRLSKSLSCPKILVGQDPAAHVKTCKITDTIAGLSGTLCFGSEKVPFKSNLTGKFNLENILCAAGAAKAVGIAPPDIIRGIEACTLIPGRLEKIPNTLDRYLFVDYAHTPDALESILDTLRNRAPGRLITVFGCGGDRDRTKRPLMGNIAGEYSDLAIVTSDNPRTEDPDKIIEDIVKGMAGTPKAFDNGQPPPGRGYLVCPDRKQAIARALELSRPSDIVVVAGKGHETYQITPRGTIHFDDKEELILACKAYESRFSPIPWHIDDLSCALGITPVISSGENSFVFSGISTDSRTIEPDQVFLSLKGEKFDGHTFIPDMVKKGIKAIVAREGAIPASRLKAMEKETGLSLFLVPDTLGALGQLARYQRDRAGVKVLAITGSSGKTSTRKMVHEIFRQKFHTLATRGNFNNEIGVPLTLLNLSAAHEWAIVEMGMNHMGELSRLSAIACPDIAVVTNTSGAHLEGLGTVENVARAKAQIFDHARKNATAIIYGDDPRADILKEGAQNNPDISNILFFGFRSANQVRAEQVEIKDDHCRFTLNINGRAAACGIPSPASFMVNNALAAAAAASLAGIEPPTVCEGLQKFTPESGRMNIVRLSSGITLIDDTYNANPASVTMALQTLARQAGNKPSIAVLGDMLELGQDAETYHRQIGKTVAGLNITRLYATGPLSESTFKGALDNGYPKDRVFYGKKPVIAQKVAETAEPGAWILVKGSRGMAMETIVRELKEQMNTNSKSQGAT